MNKLKTVVSWTLHDYCKAQCDYCPIHARGGEIPREISEYIRVAQLIIDSYKFKQGRTLEWVFNGGEPLDLNYLPELLKLCKEHSDSITLHTSGGRLWMDWWAIEPHIDNLVLTFHHWQNPALVKYIFDTFKAKGKSISITAPIRPKFAEDDINNVLQLEEEIGELISKTQLYQNADPSAGMLNYSYDDLQKIEFYNMDKDMRFKILEERERRLEEYARMQAEMMKRLEEQPVQPQVEETPVEVQAPLSEPPLLEESKLVDEKIYFQETTWDQRYEDTYNKHPSYAGQLCNAGVEWLNIVGQGWVSGSHCNNISLGNIWHPGWMPPQGPQVCGMISCIHPSDQLITKFPRPDH